MKHWKHNLFLLLALLAALSLLLSACGPAAALYGYAGDLKDRITNQVSENKNANGTDDDQETGADKVTICHKTGSAKHPYAEITVSGNAVENGHAKHEGDIIPAPEDGCPSTSSTAPADKTKDDEGGTETEAEGSGTMITICHRTGSAKHPYAEITVPNDAAKNGHANHAGDLIPAPQGGCPSTAIATEVPSN